MAEARGVVGPGGILRVIGDLGAAAILLDAFWQIFLRVQGIVLTSLALRDPLLRLL
jgi:hypothetical protein